MSSAAHDAARMYGANPLRMEWIGNIVLDKFSRSPARCIEVAVIDGKIDVGQQRSHGLEAFQDVWELRRVGRLGGNFDDLLNGPGAVGLAPEPNRTGKIFERDDHPNKSISLGGIVRG